jgi:hypothetical protein
MNIGQRIIHGMKSEVFNNDFKEIPIIKYFYFIAIHLQRTYEIEISI